MRGIKIMQYISCDMCKKMISNPRNGANYFTLKNKHICKKCKHEADREIQDLLEAEEGPYNFVEKKEEYWQAIVARCE